MGRLRHGVVAGLVASVTGSLALPGFVAPAALWLAPTGCAGDDCDPDTKTFARCGGNRLDDVTWESVSITGAYLNDHGERTWVFDPSGWMGTRKPYEVDAYLALSETPNSDSGSGYSDPAGNLGEYHLVQGPRGWQITILNDTCAQYYVRVVAKYLDDDSGDYGGTKSGSCVAGESR